jgi:anhydro-N-acetylmuramic acid kinase
MPAKTKISLGLMSGTSADGISIAAVRIKPFEVLHYKTYPYSPKFQKEIIGARAKSANELARLHFSLGKLFAESVLKFCREFEIKKTDIAVVGSHGQTVYHDNLVTMQIGEPSFMNEALGAPVVSDFRVRDMAAGGKGAPLIPFFDEFLFGNGPVRIFQNIGGIANLSIVGKGVKTFGFDTGPGNCLMDEVVKTFTKGKKTFDFNGAMAAKGKIDCKKVDSLMKLKCFLQKPPKALDREDFGMKFLQRHFPKITQKNFSDILATLNYFSAKAISHSIKKFILPKYSPKEIVISGGGAYNKTLLENIRALLPGLTLRTSSFYALHELAKEPACFAVMGWFALRRKVNHCPVATGAKGKRILGKISF